MVPTINLNINLGLIILYIEGSRSLNLDRLADLGLFPRDYWRSDRHNPRQNTCILKNLMNFDRRVS